MLEPLDKRVRAAPDQVTWTVESPELITFPLTEAEKREM